MDQKRLSLKPEYPLKVKMPSSRDCVCIEDFRIAAQTKLSKEVSDYYNSGAGDESNLQENVSAFKRLRIRPRRLACPTPVTTSTTVLGVEINIPICIAPTAFHKMAHAEGELATAKAAATTGTCMVLSSLTNSTMEDVSQLCSGIPHWLQMEVYHDRSTVVKLLHQAEAAGFQGIVVTLDAPVPGKRLKTIRNGFTIPTHLGLPIFEKHLPSKKTSTRTKEKRTSLHQTFDPCATWEYVQFLKKHTSLPIILKGILVAEDARKAVEYGAKAIFVSNHGGRQLDAYPATIEALPEVAKAVDGKIDVFLDGGIRSGTDIFKALALGAKAVFVGRPILWGLATDGFEGVKKVLDILRDELETTMYLAGCSTVEDIRKASVVHHSYYSKL